MLRAGMSLVAKSPIVSALRTLEVARQGLLSIEAALASSGAGALGAAFGDLR